MTFIMELLQGFIGIIFIGEAIAYWMGYGEPKFYASTYICGGMACVELAFRKLSGRWPE